MFVLGLKEELICKIVAEVAKFKNSIKKWKLTK